MEGRILGGPYQNLSLAEDFIVPQAAAKRCQFLMKAPDLGDICDILK